MLERATLVIAAVDLEWNVGDVTRSGSYVDLIQIAFMHPETHVIKAYLCQISKLRKLPQNLKLFLLSKHIRFTGRCVASDITRLFNSYPLDFTSC